MPKGETSARGTCPFAQSKQTSHVLCNINPAYYAIRSSHLSDESTIPDRLFVNLHAFGKFLTAQPRRFRLFCDIYYYTANILHLLQFEQWTSINIMKINRCFHVDNYVNNILVNKQKQKL